ncbi:hypothetical protein [Ekhidna sp.]|uniref:hypothetical protein n=1 Tax=Ekhidna sp. TaxID=2608089 RepID=UPI003BA972CF
MKKIQKLLDKIGSIESMDLALKATLVLFLFSEWVVGDDWRFMAPILTLSALGLVIPELHKNKYLWYVLAIVLFLKTTANWWTQDNHLFVNLYWVIAIAFALSFKDSVGILARNSRALIGLVFFFATIWKILSPDFSSGTYFHFTFLTDSRFAEESKILGDQSRTDIAENINMMRKVASNEIETATLKSNDSIRLSTKFITWHTILIESLLALVFLLPSRFKLTNYRNYLLLLFALTTYLTMPIHSFAWLIIAMGISQTHEKEKLDRSLFILSLPIMLLYKFVPFMQWIADAF